MGLLDKFFGDDDSNPKKEPDMVQCSSCPRAVAFDWLDAHYQVYHPVDAQPDE